MVLEKVHNCNFAQKHLLCIFFSHFFFKVIPITEIQWEDSGYTNEPCPGVTIPELDSPLSELEIMALQDNIDPLQQSHCFGVDIYLNTLQYMERLQEGR